MDRAYISSPVGTLEINGNASGIHSILFCDDAPAISKEIPPSLKPCILQLQQYFSGSRTCFDLPLAPEGTEFQRRVWDKLQTIAFGETLSYLELAERLGDPKAVRAVGGANGKNPIAIVIPCHRVIGASGKLVGYGGGMERKRWLLRHEQQFRKPLDTLF